MSLIFSLAVGRIAFAAISSAVKFIMVPEFMREKFRRKSLSVTRMITSR
jgi:hypothetical protein